MTDVNVPAMHQRAWRVVVQWNSEIDPQIGEWVLVVASRWGDVVAVEEVAPEDIASGSASTFLHRISLPVQVVPTAGGDRRPPSPPTAGRAPVG
jgi:hypothetical protein